MNARHAPAESWVDGDFVHIRSIHGHAVRIPTSRIPEKLAEAKQSDDERAEFGLQWFNRDALQGAYDLLPQCEQCHEAPAFNAMGDDEAMWCDSCCAAAAGSRYDDKEVL